MKTFHCACGAPVFFDSVSCLRCGRLLGFEPRSGGLLAFQVDSDDQDSDLLLDASSGASYRRCDNGLRHDVCNWIVDEADPEPRCVACRLNRTIPNLDDARNLPRWSALEAAKRRLVWELLALGLPFPGQSRISGATLQFEFLEDHRTNPTAYLEHVSTGHLDGVITINVAEADDVLREQARTDLDESYRTLLGHFRHESGHYYWGVLIAESPEIDTFRTMFGDERADYAAALEAYYALPVRPPPGETHVSAYAHSHPLEDWADSWAHYMHMWDALDTARAYGLTEVSPTGDFDSRLNEWRRIAVLLNDLNRSLGARDAYPFVLGPGATEKLCYIDERITSARSSRHPATP